MQKQPPKPSNDKNQASLCCEYRCYKHHAEMTAHLLSGSMKHILLLCLQTERVRPWLRHLSRNVKSTAFMSNFRVATFRNDNSSTPKSIVHHAFQQPCHSIGPFKHIRNLFEPIWKNCTSGLRSHPWCNKRTKMAPCSTDTEEQKWETIYCEKKTCLYILSFLGQSTEYPLTSQQSLSCKNRNTYIIV